MRRRQFLGLAGLFALPIQLFATSRKSTPADTEGPFYPAKTIPLRSNLIRNATPNLEAMELAGQILDQQGNPVAGAKIEIWQCDNQGIYDHPHQYQNQRFDPNFSGAGAQLTDANGSYTFTTLYPVPYPGRPPHIHVKIFNQKQELLTTQLYLQGNTGSSWFKKRRESLQINPLKLTANKMLAEFTFVV